jgi:uncharacterized protein
MTKTEAQIIAETAAMIKERFTEDSSGHDWYHMERVWKTAQKLAKAEGADRFIVEMAALLHDYADWKLDIDHDKEKEEMKTWLRDRGVVEADIEQICSIIENVSFKGLNKPAVQSTIEGKVVQDADRLDAIGAIAIARVFAYGGHKGRAIHDPAMPLDIELSDDEYVKNERSGLAHFYDKLLHLKDLINTASAKKIAEERHRYMEEYVERFLDEWDGKR